jgi:hypothetical protein
MSWQGDSWFGIGETPAPDAEGWGAFSNPSQTNDPLTLTRLAARGNGLAGPPWHAAKLVLKRTKCQSGQSVKADKVSERLGKTTPRRGQDKSAQGNALGRRRAVHAKVLVMSPPFRPFRARRRVVPRFPGRCPGLDCFGPFGAKRNVIRSQRLIITFPVARSYLAPIVAAVVQAPLQ